MRTLIDIFKSLLLLVGSMVCLVPEELSAQEESNLVDLGVQITSAPTTVKINGVFGIGARVFLEVNSTTIPAGETITAKIKLLDPDGLEIDSYTQSWSGFNFETNGYLANSTSFNDLVLFQVPWAQASKWSPDAKWKVVVEVTATSAEINLDNNLVEHQVSVLLPDLSASITSITATDPRTGLQTSNFVSNTNYQVQGTIRNVGLAPTQFNVFFPIRAELVRLNSVADGQYEIGEVIDSQEVLAPNADALDTLSPDGSWDFVVKNLFLPPDAIGEFAIVVKINPDDLTGGPIMQEQSFVNNFAISPSGQVDSDGDGVAEYFVPPSINITPRTDSVNLAFLEYVEGSYAGEVGSFRGLEPAFISFAVRNGGSSPVAIGDQIRATIFLSKDTDYSTDDFILREFELGGEGIGLGMLAGETINLTWFQQMPDNFEGDYYLMIALNNNGNIITSRIDSTPIITLSSKGEGTTSLLNTTVDGSIRPAERPDTSEDGRFVVYEKTQLINGNERQQIYIIDMQQPDPQPKLISRTYNSSASTPLPANGNSFRPKISSDGSTLVFYSSATNLVPGDSNNKEDVFLYRLSTDTMFRAVKYLSDGSTEELNGKSLYPDLNRDGTKIVFESDSTNIEDSSGSQIFLWQLNANGGGSLEVLTEGNGNSYNPSIDDDGKFITFDSFADNIVGEGNDTNGLRDIFLLDVESGNKYIASINFKGEQTEGGSSQNARISGNGTRIVYESKAQNLIPGAGIAKVEIIEGGYGYKGRPTVRIYEDDDFNSSGAPGRGAILTIKDDGINLLEELKSDAILIVDSGEGYTKPRVEITHDPAFPPPLQEAKAVAYLSNPDGDVYYIDLYDVINPQDGNGSKRISESSTSTGGNFGSRDLSISTDGNAIVYSTKSSNLLSEEIKRDDGTVFFNTNYILPKASAVLVGGIGEIEIENSGTGYAPGNLLIVDQSGTGSGATASYSVDNRGRITTIEIINPGENYNLESTKISVPLTRGGSGFKAGQIRFSPTIGLGVNRTGGGRIYKVEMLDNGYGYRIGEGTDLFADLINFEGDGADLNEDGFPDGRLNPQRIQNINGGLFLEQRFGIEILLNSSALLNTTLTFFDKNNSITPITIKFVETSSDALSIGVSGKSRIEIRNSLIDLLLNQLEIPETNKNADHDSSTTSASIRTGPVLHYLENDTSLRFSALAGRVISSNQEAVSVVPESNMLIMGSGYSVATPVVNQIPIVFGYSETLSNSKFDAEEGKGRVASLASEDLQSDDIYLFKFDENNITTNTRISTSSFGTPVGYLLDDNFEQIALSNRFPVISGSGRYVFFSSDAWGRSGLAFSNSNQLPLDPSANRDLYFRDLKTNVITSPTTELAILYPRGGANPFAPRSSIPVIADLNHSGTISRIAMILNQTDYGSMTEFGGGGNLSAFKSGRFTSMIPDLESGDYSLQLVAFGSNDRVVATSALIRFEVKDFEGSLPPSVSMSLSDAFSAVTSSSIIPLSASAVDPDGAIEAIQYYVDGEEYESPIYRAEGTVEELQGYPKLLDMSSILNENESNGVRSVFAIGWDNSGNYVASGIHNFSFTKGLPEDLVPQINFNSGFLGFDLNASHFSIFEFSEDGEGRFEKIILKEPQGSGLITARVDVEGSGVGAQITPIVNLDREDSDRFGKITGFTILNKGHGYDENTSFKIVPVLRAINTGVEGKITYKYNPPDNAGDTSRYDTFSLTKNVDGSLQVGNGYVIAPRLLKFPSGEPIPDWERIPLQQTNEPTASLADFGEITFELDENDPTSDLYLVGGFAQAPIFIEINATSLGEKIESVSLLVNGQTSDALTITEPSASSTYNFYWIPDTAQDYSVSAVVRDIAGNVRTTKETKVSVLDYQGGGVNLEVLGDGDFSIEANGQLLIAAIATSQFGIAEVEFFIDDQSVYVDRGQGGNFFQAFIDINKTGLRQGDHTITVIARDKEGNQAGTFPGELTNISSRKNRILKVLPPLSKHPPVISFEKPEDGITLPLGSSIRLVANASDPNGGLKGVQFYANLESVSSWNGMIEFDGNNLPDDGTLVTIEDGTGRDAITFEFDNNFDVEGGEPPLVVPVAGHLLDKLSLEGNFTYRDPTYFVVEIDGSIDESGSNSYKVSVDGGLTFIAEKISTSDFSTLINEKYGLKIVFDETHDYLIGDRWSFVAYPKHQTVAISDISSLTNVDISNENASSINATRTKENFFNLLNKLYNLDLVSIEPQINDYDNIIYLRHTHEAAISKEISVTKVDDSTSFLKELPSHDNILLSTHPDSTVNQAFGTTWKPSKTGNFVLFSVAEDYSGNRVSSNSVVISVLEEEGNLPFIELEKIPSSITFSGNSVSQTVRAEAYDPDGSIAVVEFYSNADLVASDFNRPFQATLDFSATGTYEIYALARDNQGNVVTSNAQRLMVETLSTPPPRPLVVESSSVFVGGTISVAANYKSPLGPSGYDENITALVFVNGLFQDYATKMPRTPPLFGEEDLGQSFVFEMEARGVSSQNVEFLVVNGDEYSSETAKIVINDSPISDDHLFLENLWIGLFDRDPEDGELDSYLRNLRSESKSRAEIIEQISPTKEFLKARNILLIRKTLFGEWDTIGGALLDLSPEQLAARFGISSVLPAYARPDDGDNYLTATPVSMNEVINGRFETYDDEDWFRLESFGTPALNGVLEVIVESNNTVLVTNFGYAVLTNGTRVALDDLNGMEGVDLYDLTQVTNPNLDYFAVSVSGSALTLADYKLTFRNQVVLARERLNDALSEYGKVDSPVNNYLTLETINYLTNTFDYKNLHGAIENTNPDVLFSRLFKNKYDQDANPAQLRRGIQLLKQYENIESNISSQILFLHDFALENDVLTYGGYNYTTSAAKLAIPNVPLDAKAFAETALIYSALLNQSPSNEEVALITMTPQYEVRTLAERAKLILEMPQYSKQFGVAIPEVEFVGLKNGQTLSGDKILVEASSLGPDDLAGTVDDGRVLGVELFLNGKSLGPMTEPNDGQFFYTHTLDKDYPAGEYLLEAVAEDINGLHSNSQRMIRISKDNNFGVAINSPALGTTLEVGEAVEFQFSSSGEASLEKAMLEINGNVQWSSVLSLGSQDLPIDESNFSITDGTNRGVFVFEFNDDETARSNEIKSLDRLIDKNQLSEGEVGIYVDQGDYSLPQTREYLIEMDSNTTFRWSIDGGVNFNQAKISAIFDSNNTFHELSAGLKFKFEKSKNAYAFGDRWRIRIGPVNEIVEVGKLGTFQDRIESTRKNIIRAINRARNRGELAIFAEDPYAEGVYKGSIPEQYTQPNSVILLHDASYPVVDDINLSFSPELSNIISSNTCMDIVSSQESILRLNLGDCLPMPKPLLSSRIIGIDQEGNRYYSQRRSFPVRNTNNPYTKMLKVGDIFNPGRLATLQASKVDNNGGITEINFVDPGSGYRELVAESQNLTAISLTGSGAKLSAVINASGSLDGFTSHSSLGSNYKKGDLIIPSSPAVFKLGTPISLDARLIGPKNEINRVAFYANGTELSSDVSEMVGGYYRTMFNPEDPGDYFITVRPLYGDSRDSDYVPNQSLRGMYSNINFMPALNWGWQSHWSQQFVYQGTTHAPFWIWQKSDYWDQDLTWRARSHWSGATPVRVFEEEESTDLEIVLNSTSSALRATELLDAQNALLQAFVKRTGTNSPQIIKAFLYGNESLLAEIDVPATDELTSTISFEWRVSFAELGKFVYFNVIGLDEQNRKYYSDQAAQIISEVDINSNPQSSVASVYEDLTGMNASPEQTEHLKNLVKNDQTSADVVVSVISENESTLNQIIDLMAVQHILYGQFFENFDDFESRKDEFFENGSSDSSEEPLKRFIDSQLSSTRYNQVFHGVVPHLVGSPTGSSLVSFRENRNLFVDRHFAIKYGRKPSTLQLKQASRRMLDYWSNNHEPGYWELVSPASRPSDNALIGLRRDTALSRRTVPFSAGECAVDFIYELAKEFVYPRNQAYLSYISNDALRGSLYRSAALLYTLHRENVDVSDKSVLDQARDLQGLTIEEVADLITADTNYNQRFNYIYSTNSEEVSVLATNSVTEYWKSMPWFGTFMDREYPWIYHTDLGWLYSSGTDTGDIWFYSDNLEVEDKEIGWFWTNKNVFEGPAMAGREYENQRFIFLVRKSVNGSQEGSWALLDITTGEAKPYGWLSLGN